MPGRMRITMAAAALAAGWTLVATAGSGRALGYDDARHLLARTGFGPTVRKSSTEPVVFHS